MAASGEVDLEHQLADAYGLDFCQVVTDLHQDELPLQALGVAGVEVPRRRDRAAGRRLLIGVGYGRTLARRRRGLAASRGPAPPLRRADGRPHPRAPPPTRTRSSAASPSAPAPRPQSCRCRSWPTPPPTATSCSASRRSPRPSRSPAGCDLMLVGIGTTVAEAALVSTGMIEPAEMEAIARAGGVGEMLGHFFDARGRPVETEVTAAHRHPAAREPAGPAHRRRRRRRGQGRAPSAPSSPAASSRPHHRRAHRPRPRRADRRQPAGTGKRAARAGGGAIDRPDAASPRPRRPGAPATCGARTMTDATQPPAPAPAAASTSSASCSRAAPSSRSSSSSSSSRSCRRTTSRSRTS